MSGFAVIEIILEDAFPNDEFILAGDAFIVEATEIETLGQRLFLDGQFGGGDFGVKLSCQEGGMTLDLVCYARMHEVAKQTAHDVFMKNGWVFAGLAGFAPEFLQCLLASFLRKFLWLEG